jgi:hypothetical protein
MHPLLSAQPMGLVPIADGTDASEKAISIRVM